jgi:methylated-DNA-[protein]-cysteine S-methyltransferase
MFADRVYEVLRDRVPKGKVTTYSALAKAVGKPQAARAVGNALNRNPYAPKVPCHRVIKSSGEIGGFASGSRNKVNLLRKEGITIEKGIIPKRFILEKL